MAVNGKEPGKMSLAIVEILVECNSDDKFAIQGAMQVTADRLRQKWADKRLWNAVFNSLPKKKKLLTDLKLAAKVFYGNPADRGFEGKLSQVLQEQQKFSIRAAQKAAREYTDTLTEELFLADTDFREILRGISKPRLLKIRSRVEQVLESRQPPVPQKTVKRPSSQSFRLSRNCRLPSPLSRNCLRKEYPSRLQCRKALAFHPFLPIRALSAGRMN